MAVNLLLSYAYQSGVDLGEVRSTLRCGRLMIDSGAYTAYTKGRTVDLDAYAAYLETHRAQWNHAITLDVIGDPAASARNTRRLHARGLPVMPVFTAGASLAEFDAMVADSGYVCVGGLVGVPPRVQAARVGMLQRRAAAAGGGVHALGVGGMTVLRAARPTSCDSSAPTSSLSQGNVLYFNGRRFVITPPRATATLLRDRDVITACGVDLAGIVRTRRMPSADAVHPYLTALSVAMACADETLPETRLYVASHGRYVADAARADPLIHSTSPPRAWQRYGRRHSCGRSWAA